MQTDVEPTDVPIDQSIDPPAWFNNMLPLNGKLPDMNRRLCPVIHINRSNNQTNNQASNHPLGSPSQQPEYHHHIGPFETYPAISPDQVFISIHDYSSPTMEQSIKHAAMSLSKEQCIQYLASAMFALHKSISRPVTQSNTRLTEQLKTAEIDFTRQLQCWIDYYKPLEIINASQLQTIQRLLQTNEELQSCNQIKDHVIESLQSRLESKKDDIIKQLNQERESLKSQIATLNQINCQTLESNHALQSIIQSYEPSKQLQLQFELETEKHKATIQSHHSTILKLQENLRSAQFQENLRSAQATVVRLAFGDVRLSSFVFHPLVTFQHQIVQTIRNLLMNRTAHRPVLVENDQNLE